MTTHRAHPIPEQDHPDAILFDDCERCAQIAERPGANLDDQNLVFLWAEMLTVETGGGRDYYRNATEARACRALHDAYAILRRIERVMGRPVPMSTMS